MNNLAWQKREAWFTELLGLEHGIPSHDTFGEVYAAIDTEQFSVCFSRWIADLANLTEGEVIAIDRNCLRRVVRAHWATETNLHWVLDIAFDEDSNRTRKGHSAENLAVIRHIALNLIKSEKNIQGWHQDQAFKSRMG